jgi:hypothetical protein
MAEERVGDPATCPLFNSFQWTVRRLAQRLSRRKALVQFSLKPGTLLRHYLVNADAYHGSDSSECHPDVLESGADIERRTTKGATLLIVQSDSSI